MRERSAVRTLMQKRAESDRQVKDYPSAFLPHCTPYFEHDFSPQVRAACARRVETLEPGLRIAKIIFLGDVAVGKTCLVNRFCKRTFENLYKATIGVDFEVERFDILNTPFNLQIWDTAGQERFKSIASSYYRGAHAIVVTFDVTNPMSLSNCAQWMREAREVNNTRNGTPPLAFLVGTKVDLLVPAAYQQVEERAVRLANQLGAEYWSVSSRMDFNVTKFFFRLAALTFHAAIRTELENRCKVPQIGSELIDLKVENDGLRIMKSVEERHKGCKNCF